MHATGYNVTGGVLLVRVVGLDVEVGDASRLGRKGRGDTREDAASRRREGGGRGAVGSRWHAAADASGREGLAVVISAWAQRVGDAKPKWRMKLDKTDGDEAQRIPIVALHCQKYW